MTAEKIKQISTYNRVTSLLSRLGLYDEIVSCIPLGERIEYINRVFAGFDPHTIRNEALIAEVKRRVSK